MLTLIEQEGEHLMQTDVYKTVKGWSGRRYRVQMTKAEIRNREAILLTIGVTVIVPIMVILMAAAAGVFG